MRVDENSSRMSYICDMARNYDMKNELFQTIDEVWKLFPHMRLCQLLENAAGTHHTKDLFNVPDATLIEKLKSFADRFGGAQYDK